MRETFLVGVYGGERLLPADVLVDAHTWLVVHAHVCIPIKRVCVSLCVN